MSHAIIVAGHRACFKRADAAIDQPTYDVIPPFIARGLYESVHWTPAIRWQVERIEVLHPILTQWSPGDGRGRTQHLVDVRYRLVARFEMTERAYPADNPGRHADMFKRRLRGRRFFREPYLGVAGLVATVEPAVAPEPLSFYADSGSIDLGWMVYDREQPLDRRPRFFRAVMENGVIDLTRVGAGDLVR